MQQCGGTGSSIKATPLARGAVCVCPITSLASPAIDYGAGAQGPGASAGHSGLFCSAHAQPPGNSDSDQVEFGSRKLRAGSKSGFWYYDIYMALHALRLLKWVQF